MRMLLEMGVRKVGCLGLLICCQGVWGAYLSVLIFLLLIKILLIIRNLDLRVLSGLIFL